MDKYWESSKARFVIKMKKILTQIFIYMITSVTASVAIEHEQLHISCKNNSAKCYNLSIQYYREGNYTKSMSLAKLACENRHPYACMAAGNFYKKDKWIKEDSEKYIYFYTKACEYGAAGACLELGEKYRSGKKIKKDCNRSKYFYTKACDLNNLEGCLALGKIYAKIQNKEHSLSKAIDYLSKSCDLNSSEGCLYAGVLYATGEDIKRNKIKALKYLKKSCRLRNKEACLSLGNLYEELKSDSKKAFDAYRRSCEYGYANGCYNLANMYYYGKGVKQNYLKAIKFYEKASKMGQNKGLLTIGSMYYKGLGIDKNITKAIELYIEAAKKGDKKAQFNLGNIYRIGILTPRDYKKAFQYYKMSSEQNFKPAQFNLARMYEEGIGTKKNYEKAFELFHILSKEGVNNAQYRLGNMYYHGYGVKKDYKKTVSMWEKASINKCIKAKESLEKLYKEHPDLYKDEEDFLREFQKFYKRNAPLIQNKDFTFKNSDTNRTIRNITNDFKKILYRYHKIDNLFPSKLFLTNMEKKDISSDIWLKFIDLSEKYLKDYKREKLKQYIVEKHLKNAKSLMEHSTTMIDYMTSLAAYDKIYANYQIDNRLLKKYKPLPNRIFFIKLENEEDNIMRTVRLLGESFLRKEKIEPNKYNEALKKIIDSAVKYSRNYFQKIHKSIENNSSEIMKKIIKSLEQDRESFLSSKENTYAIAGKLFALLLIDPASYYQSYYKHRQLTKVYQKLLSQNHKTK